MEMSFDNKVILAPMVRTGTLPMRLLALKYGAQLVYTEEIIDFKLIRSTRFVNEVLGTIDYIDNEGVVVLRTCALEKPYLVLQLGTSDPSRALTAAKLVEEDVSAIDVNMGCPKSFSIKGGMGAALLSQPKKVYDILNNLVNNIGKPITCKIRVLPHIEDTIKLVKLIESTGVKAIAVHGRTRDERPRNQNRDEYIKAIVNSVKIAIIANGGSSDIVTNCDIEVFKTRTNASSVMIARSAQKNCSIFLKQDSLLPMDDVIKEYLKIAVDYDNNVINTKYFIQQMLGPLQETERGKALLAAQQMGTICQLWQMSDYFYKKILPLSLRLIDDHIVHNKVVGIKYIQMVVNNRWHEFQNNGVNDLIFDRLRNMLYSNEVTIFHVLLDCILDVINKLKSSENQSTSELIAFTKEDEVFIQLLNNIQISSNTPFRVIHLKFINKYLATLGTACIKHSKSYISVLSDLLEEPLSQTNVSLIQTSITSLNEFVKWIWIAIEHYMDKCLLSLIKLSLRLTESDLIEKTKTKLCRQICDSILILRKANYTAFQIFSTSLLKSKVRNDLNKCLIDILEIK